MKKWTVLCVLALLCSVACVKPEEGPSSSERREAHIEKYLRRAQTAGRLESERTTPLAVADLADVALVQNQWPELNMDFLERSFDRTRQSLQRRLEEAYATRMAARLADLLETQKNTARQAVKEASSPAEVAAKLEKLFAAQEQEKQAFVAEQASTLRIQPDEAVARQATARITRRCNEFLDSMRLYYGEQARLSAQPVLTQAVDDFTAALTQSKSEGELTDKQADIVAATQQRLREIAMQQGDVLGPATEASVSAVRSGMIAAQQELETRVERLYGKQAVLQMRQPFNQTVDEAVRILQENMRVSQKQASLRRLNEQYKTQILFLQKQWNLALEQEKAAAASARRKSEIGK